MGLVAIGLSYKTGSVDGIAGRGSAMARMSFIALIRPRWNSVSAALSPEVSSRSRAFSMAASACSFTACQVELLKSIIAGTRYT
jgi:hypothetical protein